ncbi:hypothetical protein BGZ52_008145, partial [Haplosporangium bisporale]
MGPVTAIAHDSIFHQFFIAGRSSTDGSAYFKKWDGVKFIRVSTEFQPQSDIHRLEILPANKNAPIRNTSSSSSSSPPTSSSPLSSTPPDSNNDPSNPNASRVSSSSSMSVPVDPNDTTHILEQGYILLVSGRIVLGNPLSTASLSLKNDHQESSLAFFDGQSWFPYLQSSRNSSRPARAPVVGPTVPVQVQPAMPAFGDGVLNLAAAAASYGASPATSAITLANVRIRDQGVLRALAIAHLPRIIAREYLALSSVILISIAISLGLIILIVLFGFLYVWLRRWLSKEESVPRPKLGSSFMEEDMGFGHGYHNGAGAMAGAGIALQSARQVQGYPANMGSSSTSVLGPNKSVAGGTVERGASRKGPRRKNQNGGASSESGDNSPAASASHVQGSRPLLYRPNSTIAEATGALVTEFVKSHEQQRQSMVSTLGGMSGASSAGVSSLALAGAAVPMMEQHENSSKEEVEEEDVNGVPPSPDRAGKQARFSGQ